MVREIVRDVIFLSQPCAAATPEDIGAADDLLETLAAHSDGCVGMAANMIGVARRIIAIDNGGEYMLMFNPQILEKSGPYEAQEGCLSLAGTRRARRWRFVRVKYQDRDFRTRIATFAGFPAQIIQHELDHCGGILI
ncbi:MAG: peptide deformylase [Oscillospiraceae bacterium]|nr:peptide deformylase [Oscillospiraceae bacterium]